MHGCRTAAARSWSRPIPPHRTALGGPTRGAHVCGGVWRAQSGFRTIRSAQECTAVVQLLIGNVTDNPLQFGWQQYNPFWWPYDSNNYNRQPMCAARLTRRSTHTPPDVAHATLLAPPACTHRMPYASLCA
jgi:hypothetical protein